LKKYLDLETRRLKENKMRFSLKFISVLAILMSGFECLNSAKLLSHRQEKRFFGTHAVNLKKPEAGNIIFSV